MEQRAPGDTQSPLVPPASAACEYQRRQMIERQIAARGVTDPAVLSAMHRVPRHLFVAPETMPYAHDDRALPIGHGQTISQPYMVGLMTQMLAIKPSDRVLEIGTGSGYQAAILACLAREVVTIERIEPLAAAARKRLGDLGYANVSIIAGDGTRGCPEHAPYDAIIVTAGGPSIPASLQSQLAIDGRLVCPIGPHEIQHLAFIRRTQTGFIQTPGIGCVFVPLIGAEAWPEKTTPDH